MLTASAFEYPGGSSEAVPALSSLHSLTPGVSAATASASGQISGLVTSEKTHAAIEGIEVCAFSELEAFAEPEEEFVFRCTMTEANGRYVLLALPPNGYRVEFRSPEGSGLNYVTQFYDREPKFSEADIVALGEGAKLNEIDAVLREGGKISGTVTAAAHITEVLDDIEVCAFSEQLEVEACATTNSSGKYEILGLPEGSYDVLFDEGFDGSGNYAPQYYQNKSSLAEAETVSVFAEATKSGIDAALVEGGQITGTVTSASSHAPLEGVAVCASSEATLRCSLTDASGHYDITSLGTGDYVVHFFTLSGEYLPQFYDEASSRSSATTLSIAVGHGTAAIDATLQLAPPQELSPPSISGSLVEGQTLNVEHAGWTGHPSSYLDEWFGCKPGAELCFRLAKGESYKLSGAAVGQEIFVRETAFNSAGASEYAYSELTSVVTAVPQHSEASSSAPAPATPTLPQVQVLASSTAVASTAQLRSLLDKLLAPTGKNAKIGALLEHGGYALSFDALTAGQLAISWYLVPKGAHLARAKAVLVARGHVTISTTGAAKIAIHLTVSGRAALKHARQVKLTARGSVTPVGRATIGATKSFVLKR